MESKPTSLQRWKTFLLHQIPAGCSVLFYPILTGSRQHLIVSICTSLIVRGTLFEMHADHLRKWFFSRVATSRLCTSLFHWLCWLLFSFLFSLLIAHRIKCKLLSIMWVVPELARTSPSRVTSCRVTFCFWSLLHPGLKRVMFLPLPGKPENVRSCVCLKYYTLCRGLSYHHLSWSL